MKIRYKYRLYPTKDQAAKLAQFMGMARWLYNWGLDKNKKLYEAWKELPEDQREGVVKYLNKGALYKEYAKLRDGGDPEWLAQLPATMADNVFVNLDNAFRDWWSGKSRAPVFKGKGNSSGIMFESGGIKNNLVQVPKIGRIKCVVHRPIDGVVSDTARWAITRTATYKYYISVVAEVADAEPKTCGTSIGLDMGVKDLYADSEGNKFNLDKLAHLDKKIRRAQRSMSRKQPKKGQKASKNYIKAKHEAAKLIEKRRLYAEHQLHNESKRIADKYAIIGIDPLNAANTGRKRKAKQNEDGTFAKNGQSMKRGMNKKMRANSTGKFATMIEYKAARAGGVAIKMPRFTPTSKTCGCCGHVTDKLNLSVRQWVCDSCGAEHDRDINAAINVRQKALEIFAKGIEAKTVKRGRVPKKKING